MPTLRKSVVDNPGTGLVLRALSTTSFIRFEWKRGSVRCYQGLPQSENPGFKASVWKTPLEASITGYVV